MIRRAPVDTAVHRDVSESCERPVDVDCAGAARSGSVSLPPVALDQLRGANGDGMIERARSNPRLMVAIAAGAILLLAWIGWAIYVTSSDGASAGLGVVIAWPAMLAALALISLPFIGGYLLIRRLSEDGGSAAVAESETSEADETDEADEAPEDSAEEEGQEEDEEDGDEEDEDSEEDDDEDSDEDDEKSDPEAEEAKG